MAWSVAAGASKSGASNPFLPSRKAPPSRDPEDAPILPGLLTACRTGHLHNLSAMLAAGISPELHMRTGYRALHWAARCGHIRVVKRLLDAGADIEARTRDGCTALILAARAGDVHMVQCLIAGGANVDAADSDGWTALHYAAHENLEAVARVLVSSGADVFRTDAAGRLAVAHAVDSNATGVVALLDAHSEGVGSHDKYVHDFRAAAQARRRAKQRRIAGEQKQAASFSSGASSADTEQLAADVRTTLPPAALQWGFAGGAALLDGSSAARYATLVREGQPKARTATPIPRLDLASAGIGGGAPPAPQGRGNVGAQRDEHEPLSSSRQGSTARASGSRRST